MTDRELLEAAAKAAGEWSSPEPFEHVMDRWNPLTDDGAAFRLAVMCCLQITQITEGNGAPFVNVYGHDGGGGFVDVYEEYDEDKTAATRRAIVRAAAALAQEKDQA